MTDQRGGIGRALAYLAALLYGPVLAYGTYGALLLPRTNEPNGCDGIGFGCTLPPNEAAILLSILLAAAASVVMAVAAITLAVAARKSPSFRRSRVLPQLLLALLPVAVLAVLGGLTAAILAST